MSLQSKHPRFAIDAVKDADVVHGDVLFRDDLDDLLRHHAARQRRDVVQFRAVGAAQLPQDGADPGLPRRRVEVGGLGEPLAVRVFDARAHALLDGGEDLGGVVGQVPE